MGHRDRVSIASVAGLPRDFRALAWPSMEPCRRDRGQGDAGATHSSALGTRDCALQSPETVPRVPEEAAPFTLAGNPLRVGVFSVCQGTGAA